VESDLPGSAHPLLAKNVAALDEEAILFRAMLDGWARQQRSRFFSERGTIEPRLRLVQRFTDFCGLYPWQWTPAEADAWMSHLRSGPDRISYSTARGYALHVRLFCEYLVDRRYGWVEVCRDRFGIQLEVVFHERNTAPHILDYEGDPRRRPLTYDEVQALFDAADARVERIRTRKRKGIMSALRDSDMLKFCYAYGLRRSELCGIDLVDLRSNAKAPNYGRFGQLSVRHGKAPRGSAPKRRTVLTVPEMDWITDILSDYLRDVRPHMASKTHPALWVNERAGRIKPRSLNGAFVRARDEAGLDTSLDLHCLRHAYVTHLIEFDYPERFVQEQVGHRYASTTAIYIGVSNDYRNELLMRALNARLGEDREDREQEDGL
jgi:integrase/recombinase XerC